MAASRTFTSLVWYVSYGSNINYDRFIHYIKGGQFPLADRALPGCTDKSEPQEIRSIAIPFQLYFGSNSPSWQNGGVAFIDPDVAGTTLARAYLITVDQFYEIVDQETNVMADKPVARTFSLEADSIIGPGKYDRVVDCGTLHGYPMRSFTSPKRQPLNTPAPTYLQTVADGLKQAHNLTDAEVRDYFSIQEGITGEYKPHKPSLAPLTNTVPSPIITP